MRLIDADKALAALDTFDDTDHGDPHFLAGIRAAREIIEDADDILTVPPRSRLTVTGIIESVKETICDSYCKVPGEYDDEDLDKMIAERCAFCPLDRL